MSTDLLSTEATRILWAAREGRLRENQHGRYVITDDPTRPDRREREKLVRRGFIEYHTRFELEGYAGYRITQAGYAALAQAVTDTARAFQAQMDRNEAAYAAFKP